MITTDTLRAVRRIIVHADCPDGRASAVILHEALPEAEIVEMAHNAPEHIGLVAELGLLFCDFTPPRARIAEFVAAGSIVLDHHRGAEDIVRAFGERGWFADEKTDPGVSGAVLAMKASHKLIEQRDLDRDVLYDLTMAGWALARLVGIRDTWQRQEADWQRACEVSGVLRLLSLDACLRRGPTGILATAVDIGADLWSQRSEGAKRAAKNAVRTTIAGRRVALISSVALTSDVADALRDEVDLVAGFDYIQRDAGDRVCLQWSLRSSGAVNVAEIAKRHGGGGHTAAAGFREILIDDEGNMRPLGNPYDRAAALLA